MKLIFATNNGHKVAEIKAALPQGIEVLSLKEASITIDIPEPYNTLEENAVEKARTIYHLTGTDCFSEDTGLEVAALNGAPGVRSARYAGNAASAQQNIELLMLQLNGITDRQARFRTVICCFVNSQLYLFEGICCGRIAAGQSGAAGFGYDPVFIPEGAVRTFAEMTLPEKNSFSHRRKALDKLVEFLNSIK
jgi:XTP/dITP diphosphohydrolase